MNTVLHLASVYPSSSNRLDLQFRYAAGQWDTQLIHLEGERRLDAGDLPPGCTGIQLLPHRPRRRENDNYVVRKVRSAIRRLLNSLALLRTLIYSNADVLHAHENASLWPLAFWVVLLRRPAVWDPHDYFHEGLRKRHRHLGRMNSKEIMERMVMARKTPVFVVSEGMKEIYREMYSNARVHVINNYSSQPREAKRSLNSLSSAKVRIVYPGLIKPERLERNLILNIGGLDNVILDIYGVDSSGNLQQELMAIIQQHAITNIHFKGRYSSKNIVAILQQYHFALFPYPVTLSNVDFCLPNKFYQCIEAGLPMITTDMKEMGGIIQRHSLGYVFPSQNYEELTNICVSVDVEGDEYSTLVRNVVLYGNEQVDYASQRSTMLQTYLTEIT